MLLFALRRRIGSLDLATTIRSFVLVLIASVLLGVTSYAVWRGLDETLGRSFLAQLTSLGVALVAGGAVYLAACRVLRVHELATLLSLRGRSRRG